MRRTCALTALVLMGAPVLLLPAAAEAAESQRAVQADALAWSWRRNVPATAAPVEEPSNVPAGDLAVAFDGSPGAAPAKATYVRLALDDLPGGTAVTALTLVLHLDPAVTQDASSAPLVACRLTGPFTTGAGKDPSTMPASDCAGAPAGRYDAVTSTVSFDLSAMARSWLSAPNDGVQVRPDPAAALPTVRPFQLDFEGGSRVVGRLAAVFPGAVAPTAAAPPLGPDEAPAVPVGGGAGGTAELPPVGPVASAPLAAPMPAPMAAPAPVTLPSRELLVPVRMPELRATVGASEAGFGAAVALGALLLALVSFTTGQAADPRAFARAERRRLDRARGTVATTTAQPRLQTLQGRRPSASASSTLTSS